MTADQIINTVKSVTTPPVDFLQQRLVSGVLYADPTAFAAFIPSQPEGAQNKAILLTFDTQVQELSVKYLSYVLSTVTTFGFNATIQNASPALIDNWFLQNGSAVGQSMFLDYLRQPALLGDYFKDPATWAAALAAEIGTNDFLTGLLVEADAGRSLLPPKTLLLLLKTLDNDGPNFKRVLQVWVANPRWSEIEDYDSYSWLETVRPNFAQNGPVYNTVSQVVTQACTSSAPPYHPQERWDPVGVTTGTQPQTIVTVYGQTVQAWLDDPNGPRKYGLRSAVAPNNVVVVSTGESGCVLEGTPILMADGSTRAVEHLVEGDTIISGGGVVSVCSSELVINDHVTHLYSINDDEPFMSFEHALMTQRGWCSLAPGLTMELTPHLSVKHLTVGDVVWKISSVAGKRTMYEKVIVSRINTRVLDPGEARTGYDLHVRSGHPSYHANGYCCLVSYPEITAQRIAANVLSELSPAEQVEFDRQLEALSPMLEKALGAPLLGVVKGALAAPRAVATRGRHTTAQGRKQRPLRGAANMVVPRLDVSLDPAAPAGAAPISRLALVNGQLIIDGRPVRTHCEENHVYWRRNLAGGVREHGALRMLPHGLLGSGVVRRGDQQIAFTAAGTVDYHAAYGPSRAAWYDLQITPRRDASGGWVFDGTLSDPANAANNANLAKYVRVVFSLGQNSQSQQVLHATITFDAGYCAFGGSPWIAAEIDFTLDYSHYSGSLYPYDPAQPAYRGTAQALFGTCADLAGLRTLQQRVTTALLRRPPQRGFLSTAGREGSVPALIQPALALADAFTPSVDDLFSSPTPDVANLHQLSFGKLKNLMLLAVSKDDPTHLEWFGETAPTVPGDLSQQEAALIDDPTIKSFLLDQFALGYLTQAFTKSTDTIIAQKFAAIPNVDDKLSYFWKGDGKTSFAQNKGYSTATAKLLDSSYAGAVPHLSDYYLQNNPTDWARKLYDHCTEPTILTGLALQNGLDGQKRISHLCTVLHVLDPIARIEKPNGKSVSYATSLYERVINVGLNEVIKLSHLANATDLVEFLTEYFKQYFSSLLEGDKWADSIRAQALEELQDLMKEYAVDDVNELVIHLGSFIADSVALLKTLKPLGASLQDWINSTELLEQSPRLKRFLAKGASLLPAGISIGVYGYGLYKAIGALFDWKDLSPEARMQAILTVCDITFSIFNDIATFKAARTLATVGAPMDDLLNANNVLMDTYSSSQIEPLLAADRLAGDVEEFDAPTLLNAGRAAAQAGDIEAAAVRWEQIAAITDVAARFMTVVAMAGALVGGGFQIADDFATGQPWYIDTLDIVSEVANGVAIIGEAIGLVLGDIPVVGVVAAVVGILISFISLFIHRKPPPTPQETFVDQYSVPFITALAMPPASWLAKQKTQQQRLSTAT